MRNDEMRVSMYLLTICLPLATVLIVFAMKYISAALQARARLANDGLYQALAEKAVSAQVGNLAHLIHGGPSERPSGLGRKGPCSSLQPNTLTRIKGRGREEAP